MQSTKSLKTRTTNLFSTVWWARSWAFLDVTNRVIWADLQTVCTMIKTRVVIVSRVTVQVRKVRRFKHPLLWIQTKKRRSKSKRRNKKKKREKKKPQVLRRYKLPLLEEPSLEIEEGRIKGNKIWARRKSHQVSYLRQRHRFSKKNLYRIKMLKLRNKRSLRKISQKLQNKGKKRVAKMLIK